MMKLSLLLMNLMKLIRKDVFFLPISYKYLFIAFDKEYETIDSDYIMTLQDWVDF